MPTALNRMFSLASNAICCGLRGSYGQIGRRSGLARGEEGRDHGRGTRPGLAVPKRDLTNCPMLSLQELWDPADLLRINAEHGIGSMLDCDWPLRRVAQGETTDAQ